MAAQALEDPRLAGAVIITGHADCFSRAVSLLEAFGLPNGILPLDEIEELGFVEQTGFFWVKQNKKKAEHYFKVTKTLCSYAKEISGYFEKKGVKKLTGVKVRELLLWVSIVEISTDESRPGQTYFKSAAGLGRWHPSEAFSLPK